MEYLVVEIFIMKKKKIIITAMLFLSIAYFNGIAQIEKPQYQIRTERADTLLGNIIIELFSGIAPLHAAYFDSLVNISFYDSTAIHRVDPDFVIQGGDPNSINGPENTWGEGDSSQVNIPAEFSGVSHQWGIIGAARDTDINSANSQYYINLGANNFLDWNYTAYGQVLEGMDLVEFISTVPSNEETERPDEKIKVFVTKIGSTNEIPQIPILKLPNDTPGILSSDSLKWENVDGAVMYNLQISKTQTFDSIYTEEQVGFNFYKIKELELGNLDYYWKVSAHNGGNESEFSEVRHFISSIEAPILVSPEANDDSISLVQEFRWLPVEGATKYRLQISDGPLFTDRYIVYDIDTITNTFYTSPPLEPNESYYWQVYSMTDQYLGPKSEFRRFVTPALTSLSNIELPDKFSLEQNFPNPFNPNTTIKYSIAKQSDVVITLYDIAGGEVATLINKVQSQGNYEINFNGQHLASGIYYYKLRANNFVETKKMILLK
jgi:cyclophilin family peptidyl-prolyl cis-trans isomerase